jgi:hypothetical protein
MKFVHDDRDFAQLLGIVARGAGVAAALVEKDYWVTHCLWALQKSGLELWFKGGTSLSKGFAVIQRFSEDLDLMVQHGSVPNLPPVGHWTSTNKGPVAERRAFYGALPDAFAIPAVKVEVDEHRSDKYARGADFIGRYPGVLLDQLAPTMSPFVRFEVGRARVVPFVEMPLTSFVHDSLARQGQLADYVDNRPRAVRCVHPLASDPSGEARCPRAPLRARRDGARQLRPSLRGRRAHHPCGFSPSRNPANRSGARRRDGPAKGHRFLAEGRRACALARQRHPPRGSRTGLRTDRAEVLGRAHPARRGVRHRRRLGGRHASVDERPARVRDAVAHRSAALSLSAAVLDRSRHG